LAEKTYADLILGLFDIPVSFGTHELTSLYILFLKFYTI